MQSAVRESCGILSPELKLVLVCSKLEIQNKEQEAMVNLISEHINWNYFLQLALHHRLYPLVYRCLTMLAHPAVPQEVLSALRQENQDNILRTLPMIAELTKIVRALSHNGIRAVVIKGFPLAYRLYGDMTLRTSRDLDILVNFEDISKARQIIEEQGYFWRHPMSGASPALMNKWMESNKNLEYWHKSKRICVELHWRLDCQGMDIPLDQVESSLTQVQISGQAISVLGKEELLLFLAIHGAVHTWARLKWLYDIDILIRQGEFSWETLYQLAARLGVKSVLNQSIILSRELLETPVPVNIVERVIKDVRAQDLAVIALHFILDNDCNPKNLRAKINLFFRYKKYYFSLKSGWRAKIACIFRCFIPPQEDLELIALPEKAYFLYYMVVPFTWFGRVVRGVAAKCKA